MSLANCLSVTGNGCDFGHSGDDPGNIACSSLFPESCDICLLSLKLADLSDIYLPSLNLDSFDICLSRSASLGNACDSKLIIATTRFGSRDFFLFLTC